MVKVIRAFAKDKGVELPIEKLRKDLIELLVFEVTLQNVIILLSYYIIIR